MRRFEGSSLIEVMICIAMTSMIISVLWFTYQAISVNAATGMALLDVHRSLGLLVGAIRSDLRTAAPRPDAIATGPGTLRVHKSTGRLSVEIRYALDGAAGVVVRTTPGATPRRSGSHADGWLVAKFDVTPVDGLPDAYRARVEARRPRVADPVIYDALVMRRGGIAMPRDLKWNLAYDE